MSASARASSSADPSLIVITCASGRQNSYLLPLLSAHSNFSLRLIVHSRSSHDRLKEQYPNADIHIADLRQPETLIPLIHNATHVYHVGPTFHPHETQLGYNMIDATVAESKRPGNRFRHFVYSSVLNSQLRKLLNHDCKRYVEEYLFESGLNWTVLQPTHFMSKGTLMAVHQQPGGESGAPATFAAPWSPEIRFSFLALPDMAQVAEKVLMEGETHYMAAYPLVSTGLTTYREMFGVFGKVLGREVKFVQREYGSAVDAFVKMAVGENAGQKERDGVQRLLLYYDNYGLQGSPNVMRFLLGREPTQIDEWVRMELEAVKSGKVPSAKVWLAEHREER